MGRAKRLTQGPRWLLALHNRLFAVWVLSCVLLGFSFLVFSFSYASIGSLFVDMLIFGLYFCYFAARCAPFFLPVVVATAFL